MSGGCGRGAERVALGFVEGMAAVGFLLSVVVEGHSGCVSNTYGI
jgi:hypothetical protein